MKDHGLPTPVLEIGGTHVTAALVQGAGEGGWQVVPDSLVRRDLDAHASAASLLDAVAAAANSLDAVATTANPPGQAHNGRWGVALPGPFDYLTGIARYEHVGKFDQLQGVDVRAGLAQRLSREPRSITFLNDADAFGIGEYVLGAAGGSRRAVCITLGTGVGSVFLADGVPVKTGADVPPDGHCYLLQFRGRPLEDTVSRRAIRRAYAAATAAVRQDAAVRRDAAVTDDTAGTDAAMTDHDAGAPDVREIAEACRAGDALAAAVLGDAFAAAGEAAGPYLERFGAEVLIVGGSMAESWDIVEPAIRKGLAAVAPVLATLPIRKAERTEEAGLVGAAFWAQRAASHS
ncbi:ROK family protein [Arthrobacter sp. 754]|uniref:ROK family protein n=1 Tax=Arthrobacter sp. 754 TaxID=3156315 RepID=UPI0033972EE2